MLAVRDRLKQLRRQTGLSVRGFAAAIHRASGYDVSHNSVAQYEGQRSPPAEYIAAVARTFDINPAWLLGEDGEAPGPDPDVARRAFEEVRDLVDRYRPAPSPAETELRLFFNLSPLLFAISSQGYFVRVNEAWTEVLGHERETLLETPILELIDARDRDRAEEIQARVTTGETVTAARVRFQHSGGGSRWLSCNCRGVTGRIYSVCEDVTHAVEEEA